MAHNSIIPAAGVPRRRCAAFLLVAGGTLAASLLLGGPALWRLCFPPPQGGLLDADALQIGHFREHSGYTSRHGTIGKTSFDARFPADSVQVAIRLNEPAYCYLIAFNPDGQQQLCYPADANSAPARLQTLSYPAGDFIFGLNDGVGLQVFVLVASRKPLPPYCRWQAGPLPWRSVQAEGVWSWLNGTVVLLGDGLRGEMHSLGPPAVLDELCQRLKEAPGVDAVLAVAFPIRAAVD